MGKKAFDKIAEGLNEALAIARGQRHPAKLYVPPEINVKLIRQSLDLSQEDFAAHFDSPSTKLGIGSRGVLVP